MSSFDDFSWYGNSRFVCTVIEEMRKSLSVIGEYSVNGLVKLKEQTDFIHLLSLVEEMQTLANRMEAKLSDQSELEELHEKISKLKKEAKALTKKIKDAKGEDE
jgi:archaellum component FlaC